MSLQSHISIESSAGPVHRTAMVAAAAATHYSESDNCYHENENHNSCDNNYGNS